MSESGKGRTSKKHPYHKDIARTYDRDSYRGGIEESGGSCLLPILVGILGVVAFIRIPQGGIVKRWVARLSPLLVLVPLAIKFAKRKKGDK
jgi:hypothetical protein